MKKKKKKKEKSWKDKTHWGGEGRKKMLVVFVLSRKKEGAVDRLISQRRDRHQWWGFICFQA